MGFKDVRYTTRDIMCNKESSNPARDGWYKVYAPYLTYTDPVECRTSDNPLDSCPECVRIIARVLNALEVRYVLKDPTQLANGNPVVGTLTTEFKRKDF